MIKEAYVSFEVAKLLQRNGFNEEECKTSYDIQAEKIRNVHSDNNKGYSYFIQCPTHQMALAWLREIYNVYIDIAPTHPDNGPMNFVWQTYDSEYAVTGDCDRFYNSYEEATEEALKYALKNLI